MLLNNNGPSQKKKKKNVNGEYILVEKDQRQVSLEEKAPGPWP